MNNNDEFYYVLAKAVVDYQRAFIIRNKVKGLLIDAYMHFGLNSIHDAENKAEETIKNAKGDIMKAIVVDGIQMHGYYIPVAVKCDLEILKAPIIRKTIDNKEYVCDKVEAIGIVVTNDDAYLVEQTYDCYNPYGWNGAKIYKDKLNMKVNIKQIKGKYFII